MKGKWKEKGYINKNIRRILAWSMLAYELWKEVGWGCKNVNLFVWQIVRENKQEDKSISQLSKCFATNSNIFCIIISRRETQSNQQPNHPYSSIPSFLCPFLPSAPHFIGAHAFIIKLSPPISSKLFVKFPLSFPLGLQFSSSASWQVQH